MTKEYCEEIFEEIAVLIKDNLKLQYNYNDDALINIRAYCKKRVHKPYEPLDYNTLIYFCEEALAELINCDYLFDFRDLE